MSDSQVNKNLAAMWDVISVLQREVNQCRRALGLKGSGITTTILSAPVKRRKKKGLK